MRRLLQGLTAADRPRSCRRRRHRVVGQQVAAAADRRSAASGRYSRCLAAPAAQRGCGSATRGLLDQPQVWIVWARLMRHDSALKAGEYELQPGLTPRGLAGAAELWPGAAAQHHLHRRLDVRRHAQCAGRQRRRAQRERQSHAMPTSCARSASPACIRKGSSFPIPIASRAARPTSNCSGWLIDA